MLYLLQQEGGGQIQPSRAGLETGFVSCQAETVGSLWDRKPGPGGPDWPVPFLQRYENIWWRVNYWPELVK